MSDEEKIDQVARHFADAQEDEERERAYNEWQAGVTNEAWCSGYDSFNAGWDARAAEVDALRWARDEAAAVAEGHLTERDDFRARLATAEARAAELEAAARELVRVLDADLEEGTLPVQERAMERLMIVLGIDPRTGCALGEADG